MKLNDSSNDAFKIGFRAFIDNDFDQSVDAFTKAVEIDPDFGLSFVSRGAAFMRMHRIEESIANRRNLTNLW